jgi:hypothetical protein
MRIIVVLPAAFGSDIPGKSPSLTSKLIYRRSSAEPFLKRID